MNKVNKLFFIFVSFIFLTACGILGAPEELLGKWEVISQECSLKNKSGIFKDVFTEDRKYILNFMKEDKVHLTYSDLSISATVSDQESEKNIKCDIVFIGKYSYTLLGKIQFDFTNNALGTYQAVKGTKCGTDLEIEFKTMPKNSPYSKNPLVSLEKIEKKELHLVFSGFKKCEGEEMIIRFKKNSGS